MFGGSGLFVANSDDDNIGGGRWTECGGSGGQHVEVLTGEEHARRTIDADVGGAAFKCCMYHDVALSVAGHANARVGVDAGDVRRRTADGGM